jgi:hypothetical protein
MIKKIGIIAIMLSIGFAANAQKVGIVTQFGWAFGLHDVAKGTDGKIKGGVASRFSLVGDFNLDTWGTWKILPKIGWSEEHYDFETNRNNFIPTEYGLRVQGWEQATNVRYVFPNEIFAIEAGYYVNYVTTGEVEEPFLNNEPEYLLDDDTFWESDPKFNQYEFGINLAFGINDMMALMGNTMNNSSKIENIDIMYTTSIGLTNYAEGFNFKRFQMGVMISVYFWDGSY